MSSVHFTGQKRQGMIIFTFPLNLDIVCYSKKSAFSDSFTLCSRSTTTGSSLFFLTFGIIVIFYLPCFARRDLVCRCENNLHLQDAITSSTMWLERHVKSFSRSNKESDFIFIAEHNDSSKLIVLSDRNHRTRCKSSIRGWVITWKWNWGFKLNNVSMNCLCTLVCLVLWLCDV